MLTDLVHLGRGDYDIGGHSTKYDTARWGRSSIGWTVYLVHDLLTRDRIERACKYKKLKAGMNSFFGPLFSSTWN